MAQTLIADTAEVASLEDFVEQLSRGVDFCDEGAVSEAALDLRALANNRAFMAKRLADELAQWRDFQAGNQYTAQSLMLGRWANCALRANIWEPVTPSKDRSAQRDLYFYDVPHDHTFSFLTVGYWGPGYATQLYRCDPDALIRRRGESANLEFVEQTTLPIGKVMFYRALRDVHSQEPPPALSVSLNLINVHPEQILLDQCFFDLATNRVRSVSESSDNAGRVLLCRLAAAIGDQHTVNVLEALADRDPSPTFREASYAAWATLDPENVGSIWRRALSDAHVLVHGRARNELAGLENQQSLHDASV